MNHKDPLQCIRFPKNVLCTWLQFGRPLYDLDLGGTLLCYLMTDYPEFRLHWSAPLNRR